MRVYYVQSLLSRPASPRVYVQYVFVLWSQIDDIATMNSLDIYVWRQTVVSWELVRYVCIFLIFLLRPAALTR